ncbi:unnamed protein product [Cuscuta campestris]|uniref:Pentacotripeptide-repeat region of PRORP domain-containing protein n=1 Tax=Cuscuta campestris TaxID=132261 RepID=A0A484L1H4_9ASTE|nr:unnamed protein product [Cuscuta campestris]
MWDKAFKLIEEFDKGSFIYKPDAAAYNKCVTYLCVQFWLDGAFHLIPVMFNKGITLDAITYKMVIRQCCMLNPVMDKAFIKERFDKAKWLFTEMMSSSSSRYKSVTLDNNTFHKLVDSLCEYGFVEDALHLVQLIINEQGEGSKILDAHTCRCLVGELYGQGNARLAADALKDMVALGYVEAGPTDGVFRVLDGSLVPNSLVHILVKSELEVRHMRERNAAKFGLPASDSGDDDYRFWSDGVSLTWF